MPSGTTPTKEIEKSEGDEDDSTTEATCNQCSYEWTYTGDLDHATCPNCYSKTQVGERAVEIPMDWAQGAEETTLWMWPNSGDPTTIRFSLREWAEIERRAKRDYGDSIESYISTVILSDLSR